MLGPARSWRDRWSRCVRTWGNQRPLRARTRHRRPFERWLQFQSFDRQWGPSRPVEPWTTRRGVLVDSRAVAVSDAELDALRETTIQYYVKEVNPANGLVRDKTQSGAPASIAAVGMALATAPSVVERGVRPRDFTAGLALRALRFFANSPQGTEPDATGYKGFYYHFLDMETGRRVWNCELSTIDTAILMAGGFLAGHYFFRGIAGEKEKKEKCLKVFKEGFVQKGAERGDDS